MPLKLYGVYLWDRDKKVWILHEKHAHIISAKKSCIALRKEFITDGWRYGLISDMH